MPNLYNKLMAKDMPGAAPAPTARQMVQAPMGLRSAMRRYADGGETSSYSGEDGRSNQSLSFPQLSDPAVEMARALEAGRTNDYAKLMQDMQNSRPEMTRRPPPPPPEINPIPPTPDRQYNFSVGPTEERYAPPTPEVYPAQDESTMTLDDGTVIRGYQGIGTPEFFAHYANDPVIMAKLREVYGFTGDQPEYRQPQMSYEEPVAPQIPEDMPIDTRYSRDEGYNEPPMFDTTQETPFDPIEYQNKQSQDESQRLGLLKRALSGQGVGSLMESQRLAQLLQSLGYSK